MHCLVSFSDSRIITSLLCKLDFSKSQTLADIGFPVSQSMQSFKLSSKSLDANETSVKHGAVGYSAKDLTEFGFSSHSGRWRGFPYVTYIYFTFYLIPCPHVISIFF